LNVGYVIKSSLQVSLQGYLKEKLDEQVVCASFQHVSHPELPSNRFQSEVCHRGRKINIVAQFNFGTHRSVITSTLRESKLTIFYKWPVI
jgi:hypothetical protein